MKKDCSPLSFNLIETLINLTPCQKMICRKFYLWMKSWKDGKMNGLHMGIAFIAGYDKKKPLKKPDCSEDTVYRFFKKYPYLVRRFARPYKTNRYEPQETFIHAMQFMDAHGMLEKSKKAQKRWYIRLMKAELQSRYENVQICDPPCPVLRPNPLLIPGSYVNPNGKGKTGVCFQTYKREREAPERIITIPEYINRHDLPFALKLKLSMVPEGMFQSALESAKYKHKNGWRIRNHTKYVVGSALRMAKMKGLYLDWPAYYSTLKKFQKGEINGYS